MNAVLAGDEAVALVETAGGIVLLCTVKLNMIGEQDLCLGDERRTDAQSLPLWREEQLVDEIRPKRQNAGNHAADLGNPEVLTFGQCLHEARAGSRNRMVIAKYRISLAAGRIGGASGSIEIAPMKAPYLKEIRYRHWGNTVCGLPDEWFRMSSQGKP